MEKKYKILFANSVFLDFETIPSRFLKQIIEKIELLEVFPELGVACESPKWKGYRQLIIDFYNVMYTVDKSKNLVTIHFTIHGKMDSQ